MNKQQAQQIIRDTFENPFDKSRFAGFIKNLLNRIDEDSFTYQGQFIPDSYKPFISKYIRVGKFNDGENRIDILIVYLNKNTSIERTRTMQRNFIAGYLQGKYGSTNKKNAALVAFVSPDKTDWRFSLVKLDYLFKSRKDGIPKAIEEFTPARRWSFLVGTGEASHTAQSRLMPIVLDDEHNSTLAQLEEAFNIETVTREFFLKYRDLFIRTKLEMDKAVENDVKIKADFDSKGVDTVNFSKKLMGQIIFLFFLQKKGWFGVERDAEWGTGSKFFLRELFECQHCEYKNFFNDILEPLFYEVLRHPRDDEYYSRFNCKIPFLNGGLFDPIKEYDWVHTDILLPNELFSNKNKTREGDTGNGILDIFDRYNFTVREDEPLEKEVAIDPELLGKAYEKFNAIRPDNYDEFRKALKSGRAGDENKFNKKFGVYYTPREIVHYMCQQSLINYLHTELNKGTTSYQKIGEDQTSSFGNIVKKGQQDLTGEHRKNPKIKKEDIEILIKYADQISENEEIALIKEQMIADGEQKTAKNKTVLNYSIRGNAQRIDDALASITVCDPAVGSGAFPVGMMHEIVKCRNVLSNFIEDPNRTIYSFKRECIEKSLYGVDIDPGAVEIAKLRLWLSLVVDEEDIRRIRPLPNLDYKIVCGNSLLGLPDTAMKDLHLESEIEKLKIEYFNEVNPANKKQLKDKIEETFKKIVQSAKEFSSDIPDIDFEFKIHFSEVFHEKGGPARRSPDGYRGGGGFDVVIANPPYVQIKQIPWDDRKVFVKKFKSAVGRFNLFYFFLEISSDILRPSGFSTYIVPDRLLLNTQCDKLRKWLLQEQTILEIDSFTKGVFQAVVDNIIIFYCNNRSQKNYIRAKNNVDIENIENISAFEIPITYFFNSPSNQFDLSYDPKIAYLINKIKSNSLSLEKISETKDGIIQSKIGKELFLNKQIDKDSKKLLFGKDIVKYKISVKNNWVNYKPNEMMKLELKCVNGAPGLRLRTPVIFERNKILTRQTADEIIAAYDTDCFYYSNTLHGTTITNN